MGYTMLLLFLMIASAVSEDGESTKSEVDDSSTDSGVWYRLLEEYTLSKSHRKPKVVQSSNRYIPTSGFYITKRMGEAMELEPHRRPPGQVTSPPNFPARQNIRPNHQLREVSETDLYLLGAIEKLVYRVDYLEHRVRRSEQLIYYLMAGNKQKENTVACPNNFTRIGERCYHISEDRQINWKSANNVCKSMESNLAEFESTSENEEVIAYLLNNAKNRGKDFWLGGLNPGLLWIWSNSAKPVNPNTNLTSVANSVNEPTGKVSTGITKSDEKILNNISEIKGHGRCLKLTFNATRNMYIYYGEECTSRNYFLCEFVDKSNENKIQKLARDLELDGV